MTVTKSRLKEGNDSSMDTEDRPKQQVPIWRRNKGSSKRATEARKNTAGGTSP